MVTLRKTRVLLIRKESIMVIGEIISTICHKDGNCKKIDLRSTKGTLGRSTEMILKHLRERGFSQTWKQRLENEAELLPGVRVFEQWDGCEVTKIIQTGEPCV